MNRLVPALLITLLPLAACNADGTSVVLEPQFSKGQPGGGSGGGGGTLYGYTMEGDIFSPADATGPTASSKAEPSFQNLELAGFSVQLGAPSGDIGTCRTGSGVYAESFLEANRNRVWTGTLKIARTGTLSFLGTSDGETLQFSVADATGGPVRTKRVDGSYEYAYTNARLFFGSNSTHYDGMYRCVNLSLVATPV
jgi:hypothetical protein